MVKYDKGTKVLAMDDDGVVRRAVIVDNLSVMVYVRFNEGDEAFIFKADKNLREDI